MAYQCKSTSKHTQYRTVSHAQYRTVSHTQYNPYRTVNLPPGMVSAHHTQNCREQHTRATRGANCTAVSAHHTQKTAPPCARAASSAARAPRPCGRAVNNDCRTINKIVYLTRHQALSPLSSTSICREQRQTVHKWHIITSLPGWSLAQTYAELSRATHSHNPRC